MTARERRAAGRSASPAVVRAAVYCRISKDKGGEALGVERQEADCRELADRLGWVIVAVFIDNDISAYSGAPRPQYEAMMRAVGEGRVDGIIAWHTDRLHRRSLELEKFVNVVEAHGTKVQTVSSGEIDLSTPSGQMVARMLGAAAQHEVDHARERMRSAKLQMAEAGKWRGGQRPYGFESDGITVRPAEAKVIREKSAEALAGRSLKALVRELNEKGLKTSTGRTWTVAALGALLIRPRNAGLIHAGNPRGEFEVVGRASWLPVLSSDAWRPKWEAAQGDQREAVEDRWRKEAEDTWRAVHALLTAPSRRATRNTDTRWLGAYTYECGQPGCGAVVTISTVDGYGRRHYRCSEKAHLSISAVPADEFVRRSVAELVRDPRIVAALTAGKAGDALAADRERRAVLAARLESFQDDYAAGAITGRQLAKATATVTAEIEAIDVRMASGLQRSAASEILSRRDPGAAFLKAPVDVQRAVVRTVCTVTVTPVGRVGRSSADQVTSRIKIGPVAAL